MTQRETELLEHPVRNSAAALRDSIERLSADERAAADSRPPEGTLTRASAVAAWAIGLVDVADPLLAPLGPFNDISQHLQHASTLVGPAVEDAAALQQLSDSLDAAVHAGAPAISSIAQLSQITHETGRRIGQSIAGRASALSRRVADVEAGIEELRRATDEAREAASAADAERVSTAQQRLDELQQALDNERARVDNLVSNLQTEHQEAQSIRAREHDEAQRQRAEDFEALVSETTEAAESQRAKLAEQAEATSNALREQADQIVAHLQDVRAKVDGLYEVIAKEGLSGAFHDEAASQRTAANTWRIVAVVFGGLAVLVALVAAFGHGDDAMGATELIAKLAVTIAFGGVAAYAGRQSAHHRTREQLEKHLELDLAAIGPFLQDIEDPQQRDEIRQAFISRWMASRGSSSSGDSVGTVTLTQDVVGRVLERAVSSSPGP